MKFSTKIFLALVLAAFVSTQAFAAIVVYEDGVQEGVVEKLNVSTDLDNSVSGKTATLTLGTNVYKSGTTTALTAGAAVALTVPTGGTKLYSDTITTDNQDQTITFSGAGSAGDRVAIIFVTDAAGSNDEVITFHSTLVRSTGTLTLANAAASRYVVEFVSDGSKWNETNRTAVQAA